LSGWDVSSVATMYGMFRNASSLEELDLSGWDTGAVTTMRNMFRDTHSLTSIGDLSRWETDNVTTMYAMFMNASSLEELDLSGWDVRDVLDMAFMFSGASSLEKLDLSNWDVSSVESIDAMFRGPSGLVELDLSGWDVSSVENMNRLFQNNSSLVSIDLSGWDTGAVTTMSGMFAGTTALRELTLSEDFNFLSNAGLPTVQNNARYTGFWQNVGSGTPYAPAGALELTSAQLMTTFNGATMADTWVWQRRGNIAPLADHTFPPATVGYGPQTPHTVTISSTGTEATGDLTINITGTAFTISATSLDSIPAGGAADFTVAPNTGLPVGTHTATVTISGPNGIAESFTVSFTVSPAAGGNPQPPRPPAGGTYRIHPAFMFGDPNGNFRPLAPITRAEAATVLTRTQLTDFTSPDALPAGMSAFGAFADVLPDHWHHYYIAWAYHAGLITGDPPAPDGSRRFRPNDPVTRQEFAAMVARISGISTPAGGFSQFYDWTQVYPWARAYVYTVFRTGRMIGDEHNNFRPLDNIRRAEVATTVNRTLNRVDSWAAFEAIYLRNPCAIRDFPDKSDTGWYFPAVLAAANDHRLGQGGPIAGTWKEILPQN